MSEPAQQQFAAGVRCGGSPPLLGLRVAIGKLILDSTVSPSPRRRRQIVPLGEPAMLCPSDALDRFLSRLPNRGSHFLLADAVDALESTYLNDRLDGPGDDQDHLMFTAGRFGKPFRKHFQIGLFRQFTGNEDDVPTQLAVGLHYPVRLRALLLGLPVLFCESRADSDGFFSSVRASRVFRWFHATEPSKCTVRWCDEDQFSEMLADIVPMLARKLGNDT